MSAPPLFARGSFFLTRVSGAAGFGIGLGQALCGEPSRYGHAGMIVSSTGDTIEAMPGGAIRGHVSEYYGRPLLVSDGPIRAQVEAYNHTRSVHPSLPGPGGASYEAMLRNAVVRKAISLGPHDGEPGVPYSALDYAALGLLHLHLPSTWVRRRVETSGHLICSALVDRAMCRAGLHLFTDGRYPGDVMPADLAAWAEDWAAKS